MHAACPSGLVWYQVRVGKSSVDLSVEAAVGARDEFPDDGNVISQGSGISVGKVRPCPLPCTWREVKCISSLFSICQNAIMAILNSVGILVVRSAAIAHGLLTICLAVLYSLTRKDTWLKDKDDELRFKKGRKPVVLSKELVVS